MARRNRGGEREQVTVTAAEVAPGVIEIPAGEHVITEPIALPSGVTLVGAAHDDAAADPAPAAEAPYAVTVPGFSVTEPLAIRLHREGAELVWTDEERGRCAFVVETSHDQGNWRIEAELSAGTNRYKPVEVPPSKTDFYRVSYKIGDDRRGTSNVVVYHF